MLHYTSSDRLQDAVNRIHARRVAREAAQEQQQLAKREHALQHQLVGYEVEPIVADNPKYDSERYGQKAFVVRLCECGEKSVFKYGERKQLAREYRLAVV